MLDHETVARKVCTHDEKRTFKECLIRTKRLIRANSLLLCIEKVINMLN